MVQFYLGFWSYNVWPIEVYTENFLFLRVEEVRRGFGICNSINAVWKWRSHQEDEWMSCRISM